ncbi:SDR family oxidoreductase [Aggregatilinea lenta]|uniref:SDR family oxidoreductase n=1 Tax=Aggregatilinea lenta TaxID=913108 RepID=UPI000E5A2E0E|nr:SDR family NAD(P)-dependent oxidoreductase [Aggregatilinea lenta]
MFDFSDRVVMVTGAGGSLGAAVVRTFYAGGAQVVLSERAADKIEAALPEIARDRERVLLHAADQNDPQAVAGLVEAALERFGQIDALANLVGGFGLSPVAETSVAQWDFMLTLNARTAFLVSQAVIAPMRAQGTGRIVHVGSRAALAGSAKMAAYSASKAALIRLVESLAAELKHDGITVNCVLPGTIDTPKNRAEMVNADRSRWVTAEDVANVIAFLASDAARAVQGAAIPVYGRG